MLLPYLTLSILKSLFRSKQAMFWSLVFPLIFVGVFGIFYQDDNSITVGIVDYANDPLSGGIIDGMSGIDRLDLVMLADEADARRQVFAGDVSFALVLPAGLEAAAMSQPPAQITMIYDDTRPLGGILTGFIQGFVGDLNLRLAGAQPSIALAPEQVSKLRLSRVDMVMPALAIWSVLHFSVLGFATNLARYREKNFFVRIQATPLKVRTFFAASMLAFLALSMLQVALLLAFAYFVFGAALNGSPLHIAALVVVSGLAFLCLGFIVAAYSNTVAAASGLGNVIVLPLMLLSGVFFSMDILPAAVRYFVEFMPLSPAVVTMRGITLEARPIWDFPVEIATLAGWLLISAIAAVRTFKFR